MASLREKRLFLLDMDGTIYLDDRLFDGVLPFLEHIRSVLAGRSLVFTSFLSSGEDGRKKSPDPFCCDFQRIQIGLGFFFQFFIFFVQFVMPLFPDGSGFYSGSQFFFQAFILSIEDNSVCGVSFQGIALVCCEGDISGEGIFLTHRFNILHGHCYRLCCLGFLLQSFQFLFLFLHSELGIRQCLLRLCHLCCHSFQTLGFRLHLKLGNGQMLLSAATLSTLHIGISGSLHGNRKSHIVGK